MTNALDVRVFKIYHLIETSKYSVHDISRVNARYNMPVELGIVLGAKSFGNHQQRQKRALIHDTHRYRYQRVCSDIAGQDVREHRDTIPLGLGLLATVALIACYVAARRVIGLDPMLALRRE